LCLLEEMVFSVLKVPKLPRKTLLLIIFIACGDVESCPGPTNNSDLQHVLGLKGIKLVHQNIRGLFGKRICYRLCLSVKNLS